MIKPKHPYSLAIEQANPGSKRKASEGGGDDRGPVPDQSQSSQPKEEKGEKKQRVIDGWRAALKFVRCARMRPMTATARRSKRLLEMTRR